ncbi:MAG: hypothetical protein WD005_01620 [Haliea sp.]
MTDTTITVHVPFRVRKHGGRKLMVSPGGDVEPARPRVDNSLVKAPARAHRWKRLLEDGHHTSLTELARAEGINRSYLCRVLRLTLLAPDLVEAILEGRQPEGLTLKVAMRSKSVVWEEQRRSLA